MNAAPVLLYLYVSDVDATYQLALKARSISSRRINSMAIAPMALKDPAGNSWFFRTHIEDVASAELKKRATEALEKQNKAA